MTDLDHQAGHVLVPGFREAFLLEVESGAFHRLELGVTLEADPECPLSFDGRELLLDDLEKRERLRYELPH